MPMLRICFFGLIWFLSATTMLGSGVAANFFDIEKVLLIQDGLVDGDYAEFKSRIAARDKTDNPVRIVGLDSPGGDIKTALAMGRLIRSRWMKTFARGNCDSACFLVWAAGIERSGGDRIVGLHRPYFGVDTGGELAEPEIGKAYEIVTEEIRAYLREMQIPDRYFELMMSKNSRQMHRLTKREVASLRYAPLAEEAIITSCGGIADSYDPLYWALQKKQLLYEAIENPPLSASEQKMLDRFRDQSKRLRSCGTEVIRNAQDKLRGR